MSEISITNKVLVTLKPKAKPYFLRDNNLKGFAVKVNPSGKITFIAEVKHKGVAKRKTLGTYPVLQVAEARTEALQAIRSIRLGVDTDNKKPVHSAPLRSIFTSYVSGGRLKPRTVRDYQEAVLFYLADWLDTPVNQISRSMVEERFYLIRDQGISGGKPTYSQATKVMRILSALMNYALADELIESNPVDILKQKRIDRSLRKRTNYLSAQEAGKLLKITTNSGHPVDRAVTLMLHTGLRKNECLGLKWSDIAEVDGTPSLVIKETKNGCAHYLPITEQIQAILKEMQGVDSPYLFPSPGNPHAPVRDVRDGLVRLSKAVGKDFKCHDLRRTFATRAAEVGIDYLTIKRLLNHKTSDITAQYIQWNSKENLLRLKNAMELIGYE
ncbi:MAG: tyrosine-type recombinase/integrase [Desulfobulbaceae bacterium]